MSVQHGAEWDRIAGAWKQVRGEARKQWGKLTDDDLEQIKGQRDILIGKIQARYGETRQEAERQVDQWVRNVKL